MPRKGHIPKREVLPDPVYHDVRVAKLINNVMLDGKKDLAQTIVYEAFDLIEQRAGESPLDVFNKAMDNVMPVLEVKARRVGGSNYQASCKRVARCDQADGLSVQEKGRNPSYGGSKPRVCSLQVVRLIKKEEIRRTKDAKRILP